MTTPVPAALFAGPAPAQRLERATAALTAHGFTAEILDAAAAARTRIKDLIPPGASVFTGASETLRLSGIDADINTSGRYQAVKPRVLAMDRVTGADDIRRLLASPDVAVGSVAALTETGSLIIASASGSQLRGLQPAQHRPAGRRLDRARRPRHRRLDRCGQQRPDPGHPRRGRRRPGRPPGAPGRATIRGDLPPRPGHRVRPRVPGLGWVMLLALVITIAAIRVRRADLTGADQPVTAVPAEPAQRG